MITLITIILDSSIGTFNPAELYVATLIIDITMTIATVTMYEVKQKRK